MDVRHAESQSLTKGSASLAQGNIVMRPTANCSVRTLVLTCLSTGAVHSWAGDENSTEISTVPPAIHTTRLDYSEFDTPEAVTVITQDDIRRAGYLEISEIFRSVPGFRIAKIGDDSRVSYHGTTVIQNRRMLVTIDGKSVLIGTGQYVEFDRLPLDLEDIARVTITRGPNGAAWGDNAFLASIDFETTGRDYPRGIAVRAGGGANDREKYGASIHESWGKSSLALSLGAEEDGGYDFQDSSGTPRDDGKRVKRARITLERGAEDRSNWRFDASAYDAKNKTGIRQLRLTGDQTTQGAFVALSNQREVGESSRLDGFISHNRQDELIRQRGCYTPEAIAGVLASVSDPALQAGLLAPTRFVPALLGVPLADSCFFTDLGFEAEKTELEIQYESRRGPWRYLVGGSGSRIDASSDEWFASLDQRQDSYRLFGETALAFGAIHTSIGFMAQDSSNVDDIEWAWRAALNWHFQPNQMLRYSHARSFRVPSLIETETYWTSRYYFGRRGDPLSAYQFTLSSPITTNSVRLKPEIIDSHSIGYFGSFFQSRASADLKVFEDHIRSPVEASVIYFSPPPFNSSPYKLRGAELEVSLRLTDRWRVSGQYSYLDSDARSMFERGLHGDHGSSVSASYRMNERHAFTVSYYGNSTISGHSYDRYDAVYNYDRNVGTRLLRSQLIFQHHIGGADGLRGDVPFRSNEGYFDDLNQFYLYLELVF